MPNCYCNVVLVILYELPWTRAHCLSSLTRSQFSLSDELGFPENDAWAWITAEQIPQYPQPVPTNPTLLAEALRLAAASGLGNKAHAPAPAPAPAPALTPAPA